MTRPQTLSLMLAFAIIVAAGTYLLSDETRSAAPAPAADYTDPESWSARPAEPPPAVWESGWAVDIILLDQGGKRATSAYVEALGELGPVYAPILRRQEAGLDSASALEAYLKTDSRGRAFLIALNFPLSQPAANVIASDPMIRARFGGLLLLDGTRTAFSPGLQAASVCSDRFGATEICATDFSLRRADGHWVADRKDPGPDLVIDGFTDWLEQYAPKMAEPLGEMEEVGISEIRRPGQTD